MITAHNLSFRLSSPVMFMYISYCYFMFSLRSEGLIWVSSLLSCECHLYSTPLIFSRSLSRFPFFWNQSRLPLYQIRGGMHISWACSREWETCEISFTQHNIGLPFWAKWQSASSMWRCVDADSICEFEVSHSREPSSRRRERPFLRPAMHMITQRILAKLTWICIFLWGISVLQQTLHDFASFTFCKICHPSCHLSYDVYVSGLRHCE